MPTYSYPESMALTRISQELIEQATLDDPIFRYVFPIKSRNAARLRWRIMDNWKGLMGLRGLGGQPTRVNMIGDKEYEAEPGIYGDFATIDETEMTNRAAWSLPTANGYDLTTPVDVTDLVAQRMMQLGVRETRRMRQIAWALALNHTFAIPLPDGGIGHNETYTGQTFTVSPLWSTPGTSTPLANFRALQPTYGWGTSNRFGQSAIAIMNTLTRNYMLGNTNAADLGGRRISNGSTVNDINTWNTILAANDTPEIITFDDGYIDDSGVFQLYCPTGYILVVAQRPTGELPGEFQMTRNANNPGMAPGPYGFVRDFTNGPTKTVPPSLEIHKGFNGSPIVMRPSQLLTMIVA